MTKSESPVERQNTKSSGQASADVWFGDYTYENDRGEEVECYGDKNAEMDVR